MINNSIVDRQGPSPWYALVNRCSCLDHSEWEKLYLTRVICGSLSLEFVAVRCFMNVLISLFSPTLFCYLFVSVTWGWMYYLYLGFRADILSPAPLSKLVHCLFSFPHFSLSSPGTAIGSIPSRSTWRSCCFSLIDSVCSIPLLYFAYACASRLVC